MIGSLDRIAQRLAGDDRVAELSPPISRRDLLGRGLLGALMLTGAGRLVFAEGGLAANTAKCTDLKKCLVDSLNKWDRWYAKCEAIQEALGYPAARGGKWDCFSTYQEGARAGNQYCLLSCPPPPRRRRPASPRPKTARDAPALPPNPYAGAMDECANCKSVGGDCCFGSSVAGHLCACATAGVSCLFYGCS